VKDPLRTEADLHVEEDGELGVTRGRFLKRDTSYGNGGRWRSAIEKTAYRPE